MSDTLTFLAGFLLGAGIAGAAFDDGRWGVCIAVATAIVVFRAIFKAVGSEC